MVKKILFISLALFGLPFSSMAAVCFADALGQGITAVAPNPAGLVAHYDFEGDAKDSAGTNHGTLNGNPTYGAGVSGQAINLDGYGDYVDCGNESFFDITDSITVAAWIKVSEFDKKYQTIIAKGDNSWRLARASGSNNIEFSCNGTADTKWKGWGEVPWAVTGTTIVNDSKWHHIAGVFDGSVLYLYIDGVLEAAKSATNSVNISKYKMCIGANAQVPGREWNGLIDDVRIYNYALSQAEIVSVMGESEIDVPLSLPATLYNIARTYEKLSKHGQAENIYQRILQHYPDSRYARDAKIYIERRNVFSLIKSGDYIEAQARIDKFTTDFGEHPASPGVFYWFAKEFGARGRYEEAKRIYRQVVGLYPDDSHALKAELEIPKMDVLSLVESEDDSAAQAALDSLIADFNDHPDLPEAVFVIGEQYYNKALNTKSDPNLPEAEARDYFQKAIAVWQRVITELPASAAYTPRFYYITAVIYGQELGEYAKGIDYYQQIVDNWPDYEYAWHAQYFIAKYYEKLRDSGAISELEADPLIEQAYRAVIEKYPDCSLVGHSCLKLAWPIFKKGQWSNAAYYFEIFLQKRPDDPRRERVLYYLGRAYEEMGELDVAVEVYEVFIKTARPGDPRIKSVKAKIQELKGQTK